MLGFGYVGAPLAARLRDEGWSVTGWVRTPESAAELAGLGLERIVTGSIGEEDAWPRPAEIRRGDPCRVLQPRWRPGV